MSNSTRPSSSSYDERFVVPLEASRRGAHRARVSPVMAVLPIAAVVGIVVGAIALVYLLLGGMGEGDAGANATTAASPSASPSATASSPAASDGAAVGAGGSSTSTVAPGTVDKTITLDVFNGTSVSGLAKKAATKLTTAGWTTDRIETWTGTPVTQTTVYYRTESQRASALSIVRTLGRGTAKLSPSKAGQGMAVVIATDYPGGGVARSTARSTSANASRSTTKPATAGATTTTSARPTSATTTKSSTAPTQSTGGQNGGATETTSSSSSN